MFPPFELPKNWSSIIEQVIRPLGFSLDRPEELAKAIVDLSNHFIRAQFSIDYWKDDRLKAAYICYYTTLNYVRMSYVCSQIKALKFAHDANHIVDWGCGAGSASLALTLEAQMSDKKITGVDRSPSSLTLFKELMKSFGLDETVSVAPRGSQVPEPCDFLVMSYALNETQTPPVIGPKVKWLAVIEPSTHQAGRELLRWRDQLLENDWFAWAPCTHQYPCPLYNRSGKDWCHHRMNWEIPDWFSNIERFLPMKNNTLTFSYLLLSRIEPPSFLEGLTRVIGDEQREAGKNRQAVCRGPEREFMSWLTKSFMTPELKRGDFVRILGGVQKANEIRINKDDDFEGPLPVKVDV